MSNIIENPQDKDIVINPAEQVEYKKYEILQEFSWKMKALTAKYTEEEQKTWSTQISEALAYKADNSVETPMLSLLADDGDIGVLADKIIMKANYLKVESGKLLAWKNAELAKIENE